MPLPLRQVTLLLALLLTSPACSSSDGGDSDTAPPDTGAPDAPADGSDVTPDVAPVGDCVAGLARCAADAATLERLVDGAWQLDDDCAAQGLLCDEAACACVPPWRYGAPSFGTCADAPQATPESLAEKAAYYDDIAARLHVHPELKWIMPVRLKTEEVPCADGGDGPCHAPIKGEAEATWEDVERWHSGENDGLWSALYMASQAYRYAATGSDDALATLKLLLEGEADRMAVTGVPGLFTRQLIPPGIDGLSCPGDDGHYTTDVEKDDNRWVQIREDGCAWVIPNETGEWTKSDHCGLDAFAGYCFLDNVSIDEYAGHMFALGAILKIVDDPDVRAVVADLLEQVGRHLMANELTFVDWDGRVTEHGRLYATSLTDPPGFNAFVSLLYILMAWEATGDQAFMDYHDDCLLQKGGLNECLSWPLEKEIPYDQLLHQLMMYVGDDGCRSNWNNLSMMFCAVPLLPWFEPDPAVRALASAAFDAELMRPDHRIAAYKQGNAWWNFLWGAHKALGPDSDGPALEIVEDGICSLKQFPASQAGRDIDNFVDHDHYCFGRLHKEESGPEHNSLAEDPIPVDERCPRTFLWWANPYNRRRCSANDAEIQQPGDYLLPYWMGRYYGFIPEDL